MPVTLKSRNGFPKVNKNSSGVAVHDVKWATGCTYADFAAAVAALGATNAYETTALLESLKIEQDDSGGTWWTCDLSYKSPTFKAGPEAYRAEGETEYTLEDGGLDTPIERHSSYRTVWNYDLAQKPGSTATFSGYAGATSRTDGSYSRADFRWIKDTSELPAELSGERWEIIATKTKPGVESFIRPSPVVVMRKFYAGKSAADTAAGDYTTGTIATPGSTFGITGGSWLIMSKRVHQEGKYWVAEVRYQHDAEGWDTDIYPAAS